MWIIMLVVLTLRTTYLFASFFSTLLAHGCSTWPHAISSHLLSNNKWEDIARTDASLNHFYLMDIYFNYTSWSCAKSAWVNSHTCIPTLLLCSYLFSSHFFLPRGGASICLFVIPSVTSVLRCTVKGERLNLQHSRTMYVDYTKTKLIPK